MGFYFYDMIGYGFIIIGFVITLIAQIYLNIKYKKTSRINTKSGLTGVEVARRILDENNLEDIYVTEISGSLTDHYDPRRKVVRLSPEIFHGTSIAANSVAAHEVGHAIQHKEGYIFIKIRGMIIPFVNFSSSFGYIAILIGLIFGIMDLAWAGFGLLLLILIFQLITLPTEFNASKRAKEELEKLDILEKEEIKNSNEMLNAAALTYVAALASTMLQLLRLFLIIVKSDDR